MKLLQFKLFKDEIIVLIIKIYIIADGEKIIIVLFPARLLLFRECYGKMYNLLKPLEHQRHIPESLYIIAPRLSGKTRGRLSVKQPPVMWAIPFTPPLLTMSSTYFV